jgi:hypothetical protein
MMPNALLDQSQPLPDAQAPDPSQTAPDPSQAPPDDPSQAAAPDTGDPGTDPSTPTLASAGIDPEKIKDAIHKVTVVDAKLSKILDTSTGGKVNRGDVVDAVIQIVAEGIMSPQTAAGFLADIPEDPSDIREWVQKHVTQAQTGLAQLVYAIHGSAGEQEQAQAGDQPPPDDQQSQDDQGQPQAA